MKTSEDSFNIQELQLSDNHNLNCCNRLSPYLNDKTINLLENFEKFQKELKLTVKVDWQINENL